MRRNAHPGRIVRSLVLGAALAGFGCGGEAGEGKASGAPALPDVPEAARYGGTAVVAGAAAVATMNPAATVDALAASLQKHVLLMTLLRYDERLEPRPYLAWAWELNADTTQVVFHLRDDVRWHDGRPTTARDVAFTFRRLKDPETGFPNRDWFDGWEGAEVVDDHTIRFALRAHAGFLYGWTQLPILPEHRLRDVPPSALASHAFGSEPMGNGPFRFVERVANDRWVFEANEAFPAGLGGRPYLDRLVYLAVPDETTLLAELGAGGVHLLCDLPPSQAERVRADPALELHTFPSRSYAFIAWNGQRPVFRDARVRRALTMAIDRQGVVDAVREGLGRVANGPIGPWHWSYDSARAPLPYAPDSAHARLEAAGWVDADGDGVREKDGREFRFELLTNERGTNGDIAQIVQSQLAAVGVHATLRTRESNSLAAAITSPERRFDAVILAWTPDFQVDDRELFSCDAIGRMYQFASYCDPALEPTLDSIPRALDRTARHRLYRRYSEALSHGQPFTFLFFFTDASAVRRELMGVSFGTRGPLASVHGWWIHPSSRRTPVAARESAPQAPIAARDSTWRDARVGAGSPASHGVPARSGPAPAARSAGGRRSGS
ncbi:MAG: ABC transporter substrate-binding protein [Gemmatimonadota bacterium]